MGDIGNTLFGGTGQISLRTPAQEQYISQYLNALWPMMQRRTFGGAYGGPSTASYQPMTFGAGAAGSLTNSIANANNSPSLSNAARNGGSNINLAQILRNLVLAGNAAKLQSPTLQPSASPGSTITPASIAMPGVATPVTTPPISIPGTIANLKTSPPQSYQGPAETPTLTQPITNPYVAALTGNNTAQNPVIAILQALKGRI
jgi:hypothetical protein